MMLLCFVVLRCGALLYSLESARSVRVDTAATGYHGLLVNLPLCVYETEVNLLGPVT